MHAHKQVGHAGTIFTRTGALGAALWLGLAGATLAAGPFDGTYKGESTLTKGREGTCTNPERSATIRVVDGGFNYMWHRGNNIEIHVSIANDGTVSGTKTWGRSARVTASGRATPGALEIELNGVDCARHLSLKKV